jgi:membrane protein implicated in regulation of membrane protease activity
MYSFLTALGGWNWLIAGGVLLILELVAPGAFMLWLGLAAIVVGLLSLLINLSWQLECILFVLLAVAAFPLWRHFGRAAPQGREGAFLNRRSDALVGRVFTLEKPIIDGVGTVRIDDTIWRIKGADLPAGSKIKVVRAEGAMLAVDPFS